MKVLSSSFTVSGLEVVKADIKASITIPNTGWVANTGAYPHKLNFAIAGTLVTDEVNVTITLDSLPIAENAEIAPFVEEYAGGITLFAKKIPSANISAKYTRLR